MASLEENIKALETLTVKLSKENIGVEESLKMFESAIAISKLCLSDINAYRAKLQELSAELPKDAE